MPIQPSILDERVRFLSKPQLVIRSNPTTDDLQAEKLVREALAVSAPNIELSVMKWGEGTVDWAMPDSLPALRTAGAVFCGLKAIEKLLQIDREELESLKAYKRAFA